MDRHYKQLIENFSIYNINQITLEEHEHGKYCKSALQPASLQKGQLNWKGANSTGKYKTKD